MKMCAALMLVFALVGCEHMKGAVPLTPGVTDPKEGAWVFVEHEDKDQTGVYRCKDDPKPTCVKAEVKK